MAAMHNVLTLTTDLPFFPGKNGNDFFNLRHTARRHAVGVVAPLHPHYPAEGVANLESLLCGSYFWPRPITAPAPLPPLRNPPPRLARWLKSLPPRVRNALLLRLLRLQRQPAEAYGQLTTLANCAPYLLRAMADRHWQLIVLIQSSTEPWLDYLPSQPAKMVYFHDVRSDYLPNRPGGSEHNAADRRSLQAIFAQEERYCRRVDTVGFVSELDRQRAIKLFQPTAEAGVCPIPVDTDYYTTAPAGWRKDGRPIVLFTGHLGHPPNVDAVLYFLGQIWPLIRHEIPAAVFQVAGLLPDPELQQACRNTPGVELCPNVPDIRPYFWNAAVYVVPMRFGGGVRQKIFEAWSMEVPVVCTAMAAEGTRAVSGQNCWLRESPSTFAAAVVELLRGPDRAVVAGAKATVLAHNSIPVAATPYEELVRRTVNVKRKRPYKLLFDLRWMRIGAAGGQEQMTHELISAISRLDYRNEYRMFCPRSTYYEWEFPRGFRCRGCFTEPTGAKLSALQAGLANLLAQTLRRPQLLTPEMRALRWYHQLDFDVVHSVCGYSHPDLRAFPNILTVHDLQHVHFPEFFSPEARAERERLYRESVGHATHIMCVSEFTRMDLHTSYGVPLEKMTTVWNIPSRAAWLKVEERQRRRLLARMGVRGRYLFFPAHCWPHKNHLRLVEAFKLAEAELPPDIQLVFAGRQFDEKHAAAELIRAEGLESRVVHVGYRSPLEVRALYGGAHALVFPSLFEGFGMPVAEAIIADCPVACSQTTSLPEIGGDAAMYFDPRNAKAIARALIEIITSQKIRADLVAAGRQRKRTFSPRLSAAKALSVYARVFQEVYSE
ncbi:MAG TPA: glycosyltransferase [Verrucomicrobiae bacterium]|nr:glycosyltransferase [Verrucomicrobiae bacterium]